MLDFERYAKIAPLLLPGLVVIERIFTIFKFCTLTSRHEAQFLQQKGYSFSCSPFLRKLIS